MRPRSIRQKILLIFLINVSLVGLAAGAGLWLATRMQAEVQRQFATEIYLQELQELLVGTRRNLERFLLTRSSADLAAYHQQSDRLKGLTETAAAIVHRRQQDLMTRTLVGLVRRYNLQTDGVVQAKMIRDQIGYESAFTESERTASHIGLYIDDLLIENLHTQSAVYREFSDRYQNIQLLSFFLLIASLVAASMLLLLMTDRLAKPIIRLAGLADQISQGNFDVEDIRLNSRDETRTTAEAFNNMKNSIRTFIVELREKAEVEKSLVEERVANLRMENLLKHAEMEYLRSQMNPHFLFNTLNACMQLAIVEKAPRTAEVMDNLSQLFRHNVRRDWRENRLKDELEGIEYYRKLIRIRFSDRYKIEVRVPDEVQRMRVPPLILQPLVENAIIHGFSASEEGGRVEIIGIIDEGCTRLTIADDGCGIEPAIVKEVLRPDDSFEFNELPTVRVGLRNVVLRLRLFFEDPEVVDVKSEIGGGTTVTIRIPESYEA